mmetsp:Transcript_10048/g.15308  ORF Transcript_10048/g.15308 Transcript_10048/m.15308 type:complete len:245 (+) Transcript_10048:4484-5218(+)
MLLTNKDTHGEKCPEQKDDRLRPQQGILKQVGIESKYLFLPNKVSPFVSRNLDMFEVLKLLTEKNIVQIYGLPGLGKSCLLKNVTCFLGERDIYRDGVIYIDFHQVPTFEEAIEVMNAYLKEDDENYQSFNQEEIINEVELLKNKLSRFRKFLLAIDNIDHLQKDNHEQFLQFLFGISTPSLKIMFTSSKFSPNVFNEGFAVKKIQKLKKYDSVDLFMKKIPLADGDKQQFLDFENVQELHKVT